MKNIMIFGMALFLVGCESVANLVPDRFDNVEYAMLVDLNVDAMMSNGSCEFSETTYRKSLFLKRYSQGTMNKTSQNLYREVHSLVEEFYQRENPSPIYCKMKWENILVVTDKAIELTGSRIKK